LLHSSGSISENLTGDDMKKAIIAVCVLAASSAYAESIQAPTGWYVNFGAGMEDIGKKRNLDDDTSAIFGGEYRYNDNFSTELVYSVGTFDGDNEDNVQGPDAKVKRYHVDGFYHFSDSRNFKPYVVAGLGHGDFSYDDAGTNGETEVNVGAGARYWLTDHWSARLDGRVFSSLDNEETDTVLSLGISYAFGSAAAPAAAPVCDPATAGDDDNDGVNNCADECPNTPAGQRVDATGCKGKVANNETVTLNVEFDFDKASIRSSDDAQLANIATVMKNHEEVSGVEVEGHTDSVGSDAYNQTLSQKRADAVKGRMVENGVAGDRLNAVGYGESKPVADNATAEGRQKNRRVQAVFQVPAE
jgi:OOP family OmpA-OmpF porin